MRLYAANGTTLLATTATNENGQYFFGGFSPTATYVVKVDTATFRRAGVTNTVTRTANRQPVHRHPDRRSDQPYQDFGYRDNATRTPFRARSGRTPTPTACWTAAKAAAGRA